jgi:hypothetical protein
MTIRCYHIVVLTCISQTAYGTENLPMCVLDICISSLEKCILR